MKRSTRDGGGAPKPEGSQSACLPVEWQGQQTIRLARCKIAPMGCDLADLQQKGVALVRRVSRRMLYETEHPQQQGFNLSMIGAWNDTEALLLWGMR